ncbi:MAG: hypothetical protein HY814_05880 [Candidatus Riflebacteria bacterium]|nr:hypothetical protein [Candidatus Riflebacteria bacterium]
MIRTALVVLLLVPLLAASALADVPAQVKALPEVFVIHAAKENAAQLSAIAAVSAAVRRTDQGVEQALVVADDIDLPVNARLLEAWKKLMAGKQVTRVVFVGEVAEGVRKTISAGLGNPAETVLTGGPVEISEGLAALSRKAGVKASFEPLPIPETVGDEDVILAANAAAAAVTEGAVLRYTKAKKGAKAVTVESLYTRILEGTKATSVCVIEDATQALPAALAAAHYRAVVTKVPREVLARASSLHNRVMGRKAVHSITKLETLPPREPGLFDAESQDAKAFFEWLASKNLDRPGSLETVMVFAQHGRKGSLPLTFDRHLVGSPLAPDKAGALVGRLPLKPIENLAVLNRSTLQREFFKVSPATGTVQLSFVAFEGNHDKGGSYGPWKDNFGKAHWINELVGVPDKKDTGVYPEMKKAGFRILFNNGWDPSTKPRQDPLEKTDGVGFISQLNKGATLFYSSSHGDDDCFFPFSVDTNINADCNYGDPKWPCRRGRLTTMGSDMTSADIDAKFQDLWGCVPIFNACLVANGNCGPVLLRHGAGAVVASYISVSFDGAGWWGVRCCEQLAKGDSIAQSVGIAYAECSDIFPTGSQGVDETLRYVVFGDPHVTLSLPATK